MVRLFGCDRSFSSHIEKKKSKCDYHFDRPLTAGEEQQLTEQVNSIIRLNLPVTERYMALEEASHSFSLKRLPEGAGDTVRIVSVGTYDHCPCIGPHVGNTSEIGVFQLISTSFEAGVLRIRFKLGQ